ncbi:fungal-specific transcription factor [Xylariaceae sp. FL0255]|nr:fungal-specific transcription factor [Xylariaceae sp. FL0255]
MPLDPPHQERQSFPVHQVEDANETIQPVEGLKHGHRPLEPADLNGLSLQNESNTLPGEANSDVLLPISQFPDFAFPFQDLADGNGHMMNLDGGATDLFTNSVPGSTSPPGDGKGKDTSMTDAHNVTLGEIHVSTTRPRSEEDSDDGSPDSQQDGPNILDDNMSDDFGLSTAASGDRKEACHKPKESKADTTPAWSELKTKAGKERKRLPLACIACRRKKIRCSGEKPACKHCLRSRIPCVYKVTTRKAAPRTDYMAMLDKRLKRMEDRIIKIVPKSEQDTVGNVVRGVVKPNLPGSLPQSKQSSKKRAADEAFNSELESWARGPSKPKQNIPGLPTLLLVQEAEETKLLSEGAEALPPRDIQEHLAEVFFDNIYGQAYHLLHKPSYMRKLKAGTLPPVLVLSVCAISARFSTHPRFITTDNFLRGEEWAAPARDIVTRRYEWPNVTILTCLLILGLHEFGTCHGGRSWALGGQATRMAFALQLHKDLDYDPTRPNPSDQLSFIDREIRRRTMWACFLMDRFNSSGTDRPMFIKEETVKIQLPIKEKLFQLDMPGPTEDLDSRVPHPAPIDEGQLSDAKDNMGVAAYMIRSIALWGRIISFLNQGGKESDKNPMWHNDSGHAELIKQAEDFHDKLPDGLKYNMENLHLHKTEGMANQFLFLHISIQQNILFMNRFAVSSPSGGSQSDVPQQFVTSAGAKAFAAANRISDLLRDGEPYMITAPFVGYCAFLSSTVHIFGIFSGSAAVEIGAKRNLATNVKFLSRMKRYWGMFHFMLENLREQYKTCADAARQGTQAKENPTQSPIFQYGDWFDRYPHGVSQAENAEPAMAKTKQTVDDAVLEKKDELHTVEEYFTQLSPQATNTSEAQEVSNAGIQPPTKRKSLSRRKSTTRHDQQHPLESLNNLNGGSLPEQIQQRIQQAQQQQAQSNFRMNAQLNGPAGLHPLVTARARSQTAANYHAASPISPIGGGFQHGLHGQYPAGLYNQELIPQALSNQSGILPHLDRRLVFNAYGSTFDPTTITGPEALLDWNVLASATGSSGNLGGQSHPPRNDTAGDGPSASFASESSSAWFMPFNMEPPELSQDMGNGMADTFGMFSPGGPMRRNGG